jgi:Ala-tRNA(Pro) deacylase
VTDPEVQRVLADGTLPATPEELLAHLETMGIEATTVRHRPVFTVEEARAHRGAIPGAHLKNLLVRDKKGPMWLVVALEHRTIELRSVAESLGQRRFSFASPRRLMARLGVVPGAVTPFAVINDHEGVVRVALDRGLIDHHVWNFHPLDNAMTTSISGADMLRFLEEVGHVPEWVDLS